MAEVPLICFDVVEWHLPSRVLRQFGRRQVIPTAHDTAVGLHSIDRRGRPNTDWLVFHNIFVTRWRDRRQHIITGDVTEEPMSRDDPYVGWYRSITRPLIVNPAHRATVGYLGVGGRHDILVRVLNNSLASGQLLHIYLHVASVYANICY